jgi:hypothetical protein
VSSSQRRATQACSTRVLIAVLGRRILVCPRLGSENTAIQKPIRRRKVLNSNDQTFGRRIAFWTAVFCFPAKSQRTNTSTKNDRRRHETINRGRRASTTYVQYGTCRFPLPLTTGALSPLLLTTGV